MRKQSKALGYLLGYFLFWVIICWLDRLFFLMFSPPEKVALNFVEILKIYYNGLSMDLSAAAYVCALPFLFYAAWILVPKWRFSRKWINLYTYLCLFFLALVSCINVNLYPEWTDKISKRVVDAFFESPKEALLSAGSTSFLVPFVVVFTFVVGGVLLYRWSLKNAFVKIDRNIGIRLLSVFAGLLFLFSCIRGGYGTSPLNESHAYYSTVQFYNHAAVNTYWSFLNDFVQSRSETNPYRYLADEKLDQLLKPVFATNPDSAYRILTVERPNVVLILLESFTADLVGSLGGEQGITPKLDQLSSEGLSFTNFYCAADRSDKGIIGVFSAFPAQGKESIIKTVNKHENLPAIGTEIKGSGYSTSFYYGGQSEFYNFKSYMMSHGIDKVVDMSNFKITDNESSWGVYDEKVFDRMLKDLDDQDKPFFSTIFTITNHEPYDLKGDYKFGKQSSTDKFKSTAFYTDSVLYDFIEKAKKTDWYKNTLFVITADHGHRLPLNREMTEVNRFRVPLIFFGDVLKPAYRGQQIQKIGGQVDIAATLLHQLNLPADRYTWSRNLFNTTTAGYAFFNTKHSFGAVTPEEAVFVDANSGQTIQESTNSQLIDILKAYNQQVFNMFLAY